MPPVTVPALVGRLPAGTNLKRDRVMFVWSDLNDDGRVQGEEVSCVKGDTLSVNFRGDLSAVTGSGLLLRPSRFTAGGRRCLRWGRSFRLSRDAAAGF